jgi:SPP1 gp7 family putative phage head morphogenesis protein
VKLYAEMTKADNPEDDRTDKILAQLDIDFSDLAPDLQDQLSEIAKEGVRAGAAQISLTETNATKLANERAEEWAADRAAELVGMKWIDGELVTNPNAEWSIAESTRDMIYTDVDSAISDGWSNQKLSKAIQENNGFSESRSMMIARTETAFADTQGNIAAYTEAKDAGIDVKVQWLTANDDLVSEECEMNNEVIREIGDEFPSGATEPPQHPNCRCVLAPVVDDNENNL